jgi:hypothetical protein
MRKLNELAEACNNGACNQYALVQSLAEALKESGMSGVKTAAYKCVLGQLSFLAGESGGPSTEAVLAFEEERNGKQQTNKQEDEICQDTMQSQGAWRRRPPHAPPPGQRRRNPAGAKRP